MDTIPLKDFTGVVRALEGVPVTVTRTSGELSGTGPLYEWMREHRPVWYRGTYGGYWVVSRYNDACDVLRDTETFSSAHSILVPPEQGTPNLVALIGSDPPVHTRMRKTLASYAAPRAVMHFSRIIEELAAQYIDSVAAVGGGDLVTDLIAPLHGRILARFIGVPEEDWHVFRERKERVVDARLAGWAGTGQRQVDPSPAPACPVAHAAAPASPPRSQPGPDGGGDAVEAIRSYIAGLFERRRNADDAERYDLAAVLLRARESGELTIGECADIVYTMFIAGNDTVVHGLSRAAYLLHRVPAIGNAVRDAESWRQLSPLVDEILRVQSPVEGLARVALKDTAISGTEIAAGDRVLVLFAAANRDPARFPEPEVINPDRAPNPQLGYGFGRHRCVGAPLAHLEMQIVIWQLYHRLGEYEMDEAAVTIDPGSSGWGVANLPVRLRPAGRVVSRR